MENLAVRIALEHTINHESYVLANEIVSMKQKYPGMALVSSKYNCNKLINHFATRLETDMMKLKTNVNESIIRQ